MPIFTLIKHEESMFCAMDYGQVFRRFGRFAKGDYQLRHDRPTPHWAEFHEI
jgi:hypothetical protein